MKTALFLKRTIGAAFLIGMLLDAGTAQAAFRDTLEGNDFGTTTFSGGPLNGWSELSNVTCRVKLTGGPVSNQVTTITFDHLIGGSTAT